MEGLFPRGKPEYVPSSGPKKRKTKTNFNDGLFLERRHVLDHDKKKFKRKRKHSDHQDGELQEHDQSEVKALLEKETSVRVEFFRHATAQEGLLLLGCVREIRALQLNISLPHGLTGHVQANQISEEYTDQIKAHLSENLENLPSLNEMFEVGDFVVCSVLRRSGERNIQLSLYPNVVNKYVSSNDLFVGKTVSSAVKSKEDHGYTMSIGNADIKAFLPTKECDGKEYKIGTVIRTIITDIRGDGNILILSADCQKIGESVIKGTHNVSLDALQPGSIGIFKASSKESIGMIGKFLGYSASITVLDYPKDNVNRQITTDSEEVQGKKGKKYKKGHSIVDSDNSKGFKCCVLYINPLTKHVVLSGNPLIIDYNERRRFLKDVLPDLPVGMKDDVELLEKIHGLGAVFHTTSGLKGLGLLKHLSDEKFVDFSTAFGERKKFQARIVQNVTINGVIGLTLRKSVVDSEFYSYDIIQPGELFDCTIKAIKEEGLLVAVGKTKFSPIRGFVNKIHFADIILQHPERLFAVSDTIKCRVLDVDKEQERVKLTHKKTLLKSKLPIITDYGQLRKNMIVHGYIASVKEFGVHVNLYNNVHGFVPKSELAAEFIDDPQKAFFVGQVMRCRVMFCNPEEEKARLSFLLKPREVHHGTEMQAVQRLEIIEKVDNGFHVVSSDTKRKGFIPKMHLSDFPSLAKGWHACLNVGDVVDDCLLTNAKKSAYTRKRSIIRCHVNPDEEHRDLRFEDLKVDLLTFGFIHHHEEYGVFVKLPGGLMGLCPKSRMADTFVLNSEGYYVDGQTVIAKIIQIDSEKKRLILSLKESDCADFKHGLDVDAYANEFSDIMKRHDSDWTYGFGTGKYFKVTVPQGSDDTENICNSEMFPKCFTAVLTNTIKQDKKSGKYVDASLLHVDLSAQKIYLSARQFSTKKKCKVGSVLPWTVEFLNEDIASLVSESKNLHAVTMIRSSPTQSFLRQTSWKVGRTFDGTADTSDCGTICVHIDKAINDRALKLRTRQESESSDTQARGSTHFGNIKVGQEVNGAISSIKASHFLVRISESEDTMQGIPITGRLHYSEISDEPLDGFISMKNFSCWTKLSSTVIGFRDVRTHRFLAITNRNATRCVLELSKRDNPLSLNFESLQVGDEITTFSTKYMDDTEEMQVEATPAVKGFIPLLLLSEHPQAALSRTKNCNRPYAWRCVVHKKFSRSILFAVKGALIDRNSQDVVNTVTDGCVTNGIVRKKFHNKVILKLPDGVVGVAHITDVSDDFSDGVYDGLHYGKIVRCFVLSCSDRKNAVLSMRVSHLLPDTSPCEIVDPFYNSGKEISVGMKLRGYISNLSKAGLFIELARSVTARAELPKISKYYINNLDTAKEIFKVGRLVTCVVLAVTEIEGKVAVSLLEKDTGLPDLVPDSLGLPERTGKKVERVGRLVDKIEGRKSRKRRPSDTNADLTDQKVEEVDSGLDEDTSLVDAPLPSKVVIISRITEVKDDPGFSWEPEKILSKHDTDSSSDEEEEDIKETPPPPKKTKQDLKLEEKMREDEIRAKEDRLLENDMPQTVEEWDKLAVSSPQNSFVWVNYMTFHLLSGRVEKARAVAERALKTIEFQEENERWNIWAALMNLENRFGSEESLSDLMMRACQRNDPVKVNLHMVSLYERSGKFEQVDALCQKLLKNLRQNRKFRQNKTVWMLYVSHLMQRGMREQANEVFKRSLQCLEKSIHLEVISKFAQLEYKCGDPEHGRVLFENALASYPRRADIWSIYIDTLIKSGLTNDARDILDRVTAMNFSSKNLKNFFKKYLEFENKFGNEKLVVQVKQKALEYIRSKTADLEDLS